VKLFQSPGSYIKAYNGQAMVGGQMHAFSAEAVHHAGMRVHST